jgi:hypothetical protein
MKLPYRMSVRLSPLCPVGGTGSRCAGGCGRRRVLEASGAPSAGAAACKPNSQSDDLKRGWAGCLSEDATRMQASVDAAPEHDRCRAKVGRPQGPPLRRTKRSAMNMAAIPAVGPYACRAQPITKAQACTRADTARIPDHTANHTGSE